jgi:parallel beta-helix repeat protein
MPQPSRHASAWESVWEWIREDAWLVSLILLFVITSFLVARPFVSELISPTVIELSPEDTQETIIKAFKRIRAGGTIRLESGSYYIDTNIVIKKPIKLIGINGSVSFGTYHKSLVFRAEGDSQVQNISFQNTAIRVEKGAVAISRCNFTAGGANYSAIKATNATSVRVEGCVIRGYHRGIFADGNAVLKAYNNICESHKQSGISLFGSAQGEVSGNTCRNNSYHGIYTDEQSRLVARNNTCEGNRYSGIALFGSAQGEVSGNACRNNRYDGIYADEQSRLVAKNNTCEGNRYSGIALFGSAQGEVEGNTCRNNGLHGIAASQQSRLVARNNTCEGNGNCGVLLDDRASGRVENNTCSHNEFGIYKERTARAYVGYNECYSNSVENILLNQ